MCVCVCVCVCMCVCVILFHLHDCLELCCWCAGVSSAATAVRPAAASSCRIHHLLLRKFRRQRSKCEQTNFLASKKRCNQTINFLAIRPSFKHVGRNTASQILLSKKEEREQVKLTWGKFLVIWHVWLWSCRISWEGTMKSGMQICHQPSLPRRQKSSGALHTNR